MVMFAFKIMSNVMSGICALFCLFWNKTIMLGLVCMTLVEGLHHYVNISVPMKPLQ